jgi:hypothetical protein
MLGSCGNHPLWVYAPRLVAEVDLVKWARFGHLALVPPFRGLFEGHDVRRTLPGRGGRLGSRSFDRSGAPAVIGPVDGHIGVWARFRSSAQCRGLFLVK